MFAAKRRTLLLSVDFQTRRIIVFKIDNEAGLISQQRLDHNRRLVAAAEPDDLWRRAEHGRHLDEIGVEGDEDELFRFCIVVRSRDRLQAPVQSGAHG